MVKFVWWIFKFSLHSWLVVWIFSFFEIRNVMLFIIVLKEKMDAIIPPSGKRFCGKLSNLDSCLEATNRNYSPCISSTKWDHWLFIMFSSLFCTFDFRRATVYFINQLLYFSNYTWLSNPYNKNVSINLPYLQCRADLQM